MWFDFGSESRHKSASGLSSNAIYILSAEGQSVFLQIATFIVHPIKNRNLITIGLSGVMVPCLSDNVTKFHVSCY